MTRGQKNAILRRARSIGYQGTNLGALSLYANAMARGGTGTARQNRTAASIADTLSGSA